MQNLTLSFSECALLASALDLAATQYEQDEKTMRESNQQRLAEQFQKQKLEARDLRERLPA
jgi:hypothetical protein